MIRSYTEFFKEERDIYVQNVANGQVSVTFTTDSGAVESYLFPHNTDPVNLTQNFPFESIKNSIDLKKMLNRRPPAIVLMDEDEYLAYYAKKAASENLYKNEGGKKVPDVDAAIEHAEERRRGILSREPLPDAQKPEPIHDIVEDGQRFGERRTVRAREIAGEDDVINPRVLHLCNQVNPQLPENQRAPAAEILNELKSLESQLKLDDYEYIRSHGTYTSVKKWAKTQAAALAESEEVVDA